MSGVQASFAGFINFVRNQVGVSSNVLPDNSQYLNWAYAAASEDVNTDIAAVSPVNYMIALYNLATHILVNIAIDVTGSTFFADAQTKLGLARFAIGPIAGSADVSTSESFAIPDFVKNLSISDLDLLKTPWGRVYMGIAMKAGTLWGIS